MVISVCGREWILDPVAGNVSIKAENGKTLKTDCKGKTREQLETELLSFLNQNKLEQTN